MAKSISRIKGAQGGYQEVRRGYINDPQSSDDMLIYMRPDDFNPEQVSKYKFTVQYESTQNTNMIFRMGYLQGDNFVNYTGDAFTRYAGVQQDTGGSQAFIDTSYEDNSNGYIGAPLLIDGYDQTRWEIEIYASSTINSTPMSGNFKVAGQIYTNDYISLQGEFTSTTLYPRNYILGINFSQYVNYLYVNDLQYKIEVALAEGDI